MHDSFKDHAVSLTSPVTALEVIVPNDGLDLAYATRGIFVGQGGDLAVQMLSGETATLRNVQDSLLYPIRVSRVLASGTTAGNLVGMR